MNLNIKFSKLEREEGVTGAGKRWTAYKLVGTKMEDGSPWASPKIFDNSYNKAIIEEASALDQGDKINLKMEKNSAGYWAVVGIEEPEESSYTPNPTGGTKRASSGTKSGAKGGGNGGGMSKEEWAEKNKKDAASIARAVALKVANENTKSGTKSEVLIAMASELVPFLLGDTTDPSVQGDGDGLEAPNV